MRYLFLILILLMLFVACNDEESIVEPTIYHVIYKITGSASTVDITMENENGGTSQFSDRALPWEYDFHAVEETWVYLSAQNQGDSGSVTVTIYRNGAVFKTSTSSGAYVIATASGRI